MPDKCKRCGKPRGAFVHYFHDKKLVCTSVGACPADHHAFIRPHEKGSASRER